MNKTELQNEREDLFDESFDFQSEDVDRIKKFVENFVMRLVFRFVIIMV